MMCIAVIFAEAKQSVGILCCYGPYPSTCVKECCFRGLGTGCFLPRGCSFTQSRGRVSLCRFKKHRSIRNHRCVSICFLAIKKNKDCQQERNIIYVLKINGMRKLVLAKNRNKHSQVKYNVILYCFVFPVSFSENSVESLVYMQVGYAWVVYINQNMD